jgi:very-short-patch-repair endonuclease
MRLDAYFPTANLVLEYDGPQHQEFRPHYHVNQQQFLELQQRDREKDVLLAQHGIPLLRISYQEPRTEGHLRERLGILHITATTNVNPMPR